MKKFLKILGGILGVLIIIIVIVLIWALKKVDYTPYFETSYYQTTRHRLDSLFKNLSPVRGKVYAGFARVSITPQLGAKKDDPEKGAFKAVPLAGFGDRKGKPAEGIHDSIFVKAVALRVKEDTLVFIGSDLLIIPPNISEGVTKIVKKDLAMHRSQLFFSATHTHSSLGAWSGGYVGKAFAGDPNPNVVKWLIQQYSRAVEKAVDNLQPATVGSGVFQAPDYVKNRLVGNKGFVNTQFAWMVVKQDTGRKAILGSFPAHPTTLGGWNKKISADYPGYWQRSMEHKGYDLAVYFAGPVGSHSARSKGDKFDSPEYIGEALADSTMKYTFHAQLHDSLLLASMTLKMDLPEFQVRVTDDLCLNETIVHKLFPHVGDVYLQEARIGNMIRITTPCDFSGELALDYQNAVCQKGMNAMVTSFNGSYIGYIIPGKYYHLNEYESRLMSWFGPYTGPYFDEMIRRMLGKVE